MRSNAKQTATQRIQILFQQAKSVYSANPKLSSHYIETARKIAMATKIRMLPVHKRQICKKCNMLFVQGDNCRVRIRQRREPHVVITCLHCGYKTRILLRSEKGENKT